MPLWQVSANPPEIFAGVDLKLQDLTTRFGGTPVSHRKMEVFQTFAGIRGPISDQVATDFVGSYELRFVLSPGDMNNRNSDAAFQAASGDPSATASYNFLAGQVNLGFPISDQVGYEVNFAGQIASDTLPGSERFTLGGSNSVRGFHVAEAQGDTGFNLRQTFALNGLRTDFVQPNLFADFGFAKIDATNLETRIASIGTELNFTVTESLVAQVHLAYQYKNDNTGTETGTSAFLALTQRF
jgi:hemolysin activation/secretion protein